MMAQAEMSEAIKTPIRRRGQLQTAMACAGDDFRSHSHSHLSRSHCQVPYYILVRYHLTRKNDTFVHS